LAFVTSIVLFVGVSFLTQPKINTMDEDIHHAMEF
jgi:hypothetical protein